MGPSFGRGRKRMSKSNVELTAEAVRKAIEDGKPTSMTKLAHWLGYKGSVSSGLTRKFRQLIPEVVYRGHPCSYVAFMAPALNS